MAKLSFNLLLALSSYYASSSMAHAKRLFWPFNNNMNENNLKIVGGQVANKDRYGYIVSLVDNDFNFCGGT